MSDSTSGKAPAYQLVYFPYLGLTSGEQLRFGPLEVWSSSLLRERIRAEDLRERVRQILDCHRAHSAKPGKAPALQGIGVVSRGSANLASLIPRYSGEVQELRRALFLAGLSNNVTLRGENAGHSIYTAENFTSISQRFSLDSPYFGETTGAIVSIRLLGYRIGEVSFPTPSYIPQPPVFRHDRELFEGLARLRGIDRRRYRRILDAASVFLESYYNNQDVDVRARVLLQASAFEILLGLPARQPRKVFKEEIERYCCQPRDRRYRYKYETSGGLKPESRTQKGIWADRFYTLRNHIIHGERVPGREYVYRGAQHHVLVAPIFFVHVVKQIVEEGLAGLDPPIRFFSRVDWVPAQGGEEEDGAWAGGFQIDRDLGPYLEATLAAAALT